MGGMIMVREVRPDDWEMLRDVRLAALAEAPSAFGSTYAREAGFTEERWRGRISERSVTFFALAGPADGTSPGAGEPAGLAGVFVEDAAPELVSMWVRPGARGLGLGEALVEAALAWALGRGYPALSLWVTEGNGAARRLYERCGFRATGEAQPLPSDPSVPEIRMRRAL
jgi:GNAT superfamily N-acetyltransferase